MNRLLLASVLCVLLAGPCLRAQVITPIDSRVRMIDGLQITLANALAPAGDFAAVPSPFQPRKPKAEAAPSKDLANLPVAGSQPGQALADPVALRIIADQFKPIGSLVLGTRGMLQLANGQTMGVGETFKAEIQGQVYEVQIAEVTTHGYQLTLGSAQVRKTFLTTTGATQ